MTGPDFFDTNILVYAYDSRDQKKQKKAVELIRYGIKNESVVISTQVLGEFFIVVTRKIKKPMSVWDVRQIIGSISIIPVQEIDLLIVKRALEIVEKYKISYWDSLIVAAAERAKCKRVVTEDINAGQSYYGIVAVNPFQ